MNPIKYPLGDWRALDQDQRAFLERKFARAAPILRRDGDAPLIQLVIPIANMQWRLALDEWMKAQEGLGILPEGTLELEDQEMWRRVCDPRAIGEGARIQKIPVSSADPTPEEVTRERARLRADLSAILKRLQDMQ